MRSTQKQIEKAIIGQRLAIARESLGLKQRELAIILGYETYAPIKDMETGVTQLKRPIAKLLEVTVGIRERWLFDGEEPMVKEPPSISPAPAPSRPPHSIPIISWVQAGDWSEVSDPFQPGFAEEWVDTTETNNPNAFALTVHGDSMEPEFAEGDIITVDPGRAYCSGSYVIAKNGEEATFKQLILDGSSVFLKPLNERYPIKDMTGIEIRIVGVVIEKRKRYM